MQERNKLQWTRASWYSNQTPPSKPFVSHGQTRDSAHLTSEDFFRNDEQMSSQINKPPGFQPCTTHCGRRQFWCTKRRQTSQFDFVNSIALITGSHLVLFAGRQHTLAVHWSRGKQYTMKPMRFEFLVAVACCFACLEPAESKDPWSTFYEVVQNCGGSSYVAPTWCSSQEVIRNFPPTSAQQLCLRPEKMEIGTWQNSQGNEFWVVSTTTYVYDVMIVLIA